MGSFLGLDSGAADLAAAAAVILPVPYDLTSTWKKGADAGPEAILAASAALERYDIETDSEPWRLGIVTLEPLVHTGGPGQLAIRVARRIEDQLTAGRLPVVLGGEHSVSIGAMRAAAARHDDLSILQLDAHADTREEYEGSRHSHACVMARARELGSIVQVGIRSVDATEITALDRDRVFWARDIHASPDDSWMDAVVERLTASCWVTIDLDAFDPSIVPATGTPEPGGLSWYQVTDLLSRVAASRQVVGFDVVELAPRPGQHASEFLAAKLVYRFLAMILRNRRP